MPHTRVWHCVPNCSNVPQMLLPDEAALCFKVTFFIQRVCLYICASMCVPVCASVCQCVLVCVQICNILCGGDLEALRVSELSAGVRNVCHFGGLLILN